MNTNKKKDITGNVYGELTVLKIDENWTKNRRTHWICKCSCGKIITRSVSNLNNKQVCSCGDIVHKKIQDLTGKTFGELTIIGLSDKRTYNGRLYWKCKCSCGKEKEVTGHFLKNGDVRTCGNSIHYVGKKSVRWKGYGELSGRTYSRIVYNAKKRNLKLSVKIEFLWDLFLKQNKKCALTGSELEINVTASVDRIDSKKGYTKDNVQWVHKKVNLMKGTMSQKDFIETCKSVVETNDKNR